MVESRFYRCGRRRIGIGSSGYSVRPVDRLSRCAEALRTTADAGGSTRRIFGRADDGVPFRKDSFDKRLGGIVQSPAGHHIAPWFDYGVPCPSRVDAAARDIFETGQSLWRD